MEIRAIHQKLIEGVIGMLENKKKSDIFIAKTIEEKLVTTDNNEHAIRTIKALRYSARQKQQAINTLKRLHSTC